MTGEGSNVVEPMIREARIGDGKPVLKFTRSTFSWGDQIEQVFGKWLTDKLGKLLTSVFGRHWRV